MGFRGRKEGRVAAKIKISEAIKRYHRRIDV